jgi:cytoskeletal protein CcmA (bactofilin family)
VLEGETFTCGVHKIEGDLHLKGTIYLDGNMNHESVWVFQVGGSLTVDPDTEIVMLGNGNALNVFWQVGGSVQLGEYSLFRGTILSFCRILLDEGARVHGRLFADARYMIDSVISKGLYDPAIYDSWFSEIPSPTPTAAR